MDSLWVGQFSIVEGAVQEDGPWLDIFPGHRRTDSDTADLYVIVEPALPGSEEHCQQLVATIGEIFHQSNLSLTGSLLNAFQVSHEQMRNWNQQSLQEHHLAVGISCLVLHGNEAYLAQVGPSVAYLRLDGDLTRAIPNIPEAVQPLGLYEEMRPAFRRYKVSGGDRVLLASSVLVETVGEDQIDTSLALPADDCLNRIYRGASNLTDVGALLLVIGKDTS